MALSRSMFSQSVMVTWVLERYGMSHPTALLRYHTWEWACGIVERAECVMMAEDSKLDHGKRLPRQVLRKSGVA